MLLRTSSQCAALPSTHTVMLGLQNIITDFHHQMYSDTHDRLIPQSRECRAYLLGDRGELEGARETLVSLRVIVLQGDLHINVNRDVRVDTPDCGHAPEPPRLCNDRRAPPGSHKILKYLLTRWPTTPSWLYVHPSPRSHHSINSLPRAQATRCESASSGLWHPYPSPAVSHCGLMAKYTPAPPQNDNPGDCR